MKTEVKKLESNKREIGIEVSAEIVKNKFEEVFVKIGKEAKVKGFRPGHIPRDILEKEYAHLAHEQVLKELIPDIYNQAVEKEGLDVVGMPDISDVKLERANLSFKATVEVKPEIQLKNYKGIKINYSKVEVSADELKRSLDSIKESRKIDHLDDSFARSLGYLNVAELEKAVERQLFTQKDNQQRHKIEDEIIEGILKNLDFKLPQSLVSQQLESLVRQAKVDLALKGIPHEKIDEEEKKIKQDLEPQARQQVKVYLVLAEIAKKENIPLDNQMPHKVLEFLLREADWSGVS